ncbi:MAG: hypothetical protein AAB599_02290 [Patescibacteria group bacterium]
MPAQPLPTVSSKPRPKALVKGFENVDAQKQESNELSEIIRAAGEQVGGYQFKPELHNPIPGHDALEKLCEQDEAFKKSNYPTLKERLAQIHQQKKQVELQKNRETKELKNRKALAQKNAATPADANSKGSLKERMLSAMGIKRGRKTASAADKSQTREIAKTPSQ